ncbi:chaplin family protein [Nocardiopsis algeriensis]|uniref:Chaplin domain-containing protein n=1 Tax=Nocardiopsis algeriensis TaxID=1478215 RepID=A0A841IXJ2_9ACTN|nr:chaplin family protein [Nocardiopsis algeriensis]MBB6120891.1 hypothetical protein [Nocardiopsis algeriensis]
MLKKAFAASAIVAAAAGVLFTGAPAMANSNAFTSGNGSVLGGNQVIADLDIPVNVCGTAVAVLGIANAKCVDSEASIENEG